ncbi:G-type lectin S-receptor-like serine/threonine-protein kinase CES101 isoform X1 [Hevea brasiliensis]|uniref:G-type lectin S-receptor-like serine/threonine-protein kinase CES101 isoform X1 n=1 Tax=Hevea brasiliensis TaxID=3981 RepID=UPI0025EB5A72|nr:G-type lectin S-receptor-like serine/threonine-protein kinase CES101 isoform X1 [Hevea brasiliensis]
MASSAITLILLSLSCFILLTRPSASQKTTIVQGEQLKGELSANNSLFTLRFQETAIPERDLRSYLAIYYTYESSYPVWVANRDAPVLGTSGILTIDGNGSLKILHDGGEPIFLYKVQRPSNTSATLEDSGNFVLHQVNPDGSKQVLWQSFDYPTDTLLPGMKLGINLGTRHKWFLTSRRSSVSPASGSFTFGVDPNVTNQLVIRWLGDVFWTSGPWQRGRFNLLNDSSLNEIYKFNYFSNENETYFNYSVNTAISIFPMLRINSDGDLVGFRVNGYNQEVSCSFPYAGRMIPVDGCVQQKLPECRSPEDISKFTPHDGYMSYNGFVEYSATENLTLQDCRAKCLNSCSCAAYASKYNDDTGCEIWSTTAGFRRTSSDGQRQIYFIGKENKWWLWLTIAVGGVAIIPPVFSFCYVLWTKLKELKEKGETRIDQKTLLNELGGNATERQEEGESELHVFSFEIIATATNYFSAANKLGKGGFGPVYKGRLTDGKEIAVKRLSTNSGQGLVEFKNEAILIAKLQHTNLVRLLGFCIQGQEKILVYEYMPNKSLDFYIFVSSRKSILDWKKRFNIIEGIAQGLLYLHKYSRLRVIHRDLKASNILLDDEMNPKISDFGMARIFGLKESEANTNRIVGTYGYMSPEYAMNGIVSIKIDVFSFGVLLLEIVSGKKNNGSYHHEHQLNLIGYAWQIWNEGCGLDLLDPILKEFCPQNVLRCIHVGLLCVQYHATDRPTMSDVVSMLSNETMQLPEPKQPAFFINAVAEEPDIPDSQSDNCSINQVSISVMVAR